MSLTPEQDEILDLRDQVYDLQELNRRLVDALAPHGCLFPPSWGLNPQEAAALALLVANPVVKNQSIPHHCITVYRIRRKLRHLKVEIVSRHGIGFELTESSRAILNTRIRQRMGYFHKVSPRSKKSENNSINLLT